MYKRQVSGLSEGMFWDFKNNRVADFLMDYYGFDSSLIADIKPVSYTHLDVYKRQAVDCPMPFAVK